VVLLAGAGYAVWRFYPRVEPFSSISIDQITDSGDITDDALFPDGKTLAEVKSNGGQLSLWVRNIPTNTDTQVLAATELMYNGLTISPDGNRLFFVRQDESDAKYSNLYSMSVLGGRPQQLLHDIDGPVSFSPDGKKIAYIRKQKPSAGGFSSELHFADAEGNNDEVLSKNSGNLPVSGPSFSPDGSELAWAQGERTGTVVIVMRVDSKHQDRISLPEDALLVRRLTWLPDGKHLLLNVLLISSNHKGCFQFAVMTLPSGKFRRVTNDAANYQGLTLSADARTVVGVITGSGGSRIDYFRGSDGAVEDSNSFRHELLGLNWIDDEHLALFEMPGGVPGITMTDRTAGWSHPVELGTRAHALPAGLSSCAGKYLIFVGVGSNVSDMDGIYRARADGTDLGPLAGTDGGTEPFCAPHSNVVHYMIRGSKGEISAWTVPIEGGTPQKVMDLPPQAHPTYSSDGSALAYKVQSNAGWNIVVEDLQKRKTIHEFALKESAARAGIGFSPDDKAITYIDKIEKDFVIVGQPIDGSPSHVIAKVGREPAQGFAWSPSGKELAVLRSIATSDVVLITDTSAKGKN
jgi:Tol biopolymer transport system component